MTTSLADLGPDIEGAVRDALRADATVAGLVGGVFLAVDTVDDAVAYIVVSRIGGGDHPTSDAPIDLPLVQIDAWGPLRSKAKARSTANAAGAVVRRLGGVVISDIWVPAPENRRPRYVITASFVSLAAT